MAGLWITPAELSATASALPSAQDACESASYILWGMSGRKFSGLQTVTERYGKSLPDLSLRLTQLGLVFTTLSRVAEVLPEYASDLNNRLRLRGRPVRSITSVFSVATGLEISQTDYSLEEHNTLVFDYVLTEEVEVTYVYGTPPPTAGKMAALALAEQFALLWGGAAEECTLPDRVTNVTRQGVSWVLLDNQDFIAELRTGVYAIDLFLKTANPNKAINPAKVFSPDIRRGRRPNPLV